MMPYSDLIYRLFHANLFGGMKLGLNNMRRLQEILNFPDRSFASIHVAGTNGKGSVVTKIALALQTAGYRVGLYTSPHLSCFRERIMVNGKMISEADVESILSFLFTLIDKEGIPATFFELTTFMAFLHFMNEKVDVAVLETGLGGRLDATNIVTPLLSVITSISLDHTDILGSTIEAIAKEKAGIIKPNVPVIIGPRVPLSVIKEVADRQNSPCFQMTQFSPLFEQENRLVALAALEQLSLKLAISKDAIISGLEGRQPCRFETLWTPSPVVLDVAHNPDGLRHLFEAIQQNFPGYSFRILFGLSKNKDIKGCLKVIQQHGTAYHLVKAIHSRGAPTALLDEGLKQLGVNPHKIFIEADIVIGMHHALQQAAQHQQVLVVCGSFFIMSPVRQALGIEEPRDEVDMNER